MLNQTRNNNAKTQSTYRKKKIKVYKDDITDVNTQGCSRSSQENDFQLHSSQNSSVSTQPVQKRRTIQSVKCSTTMNSFSRTESSVSTESVGVKLYGLKSVFKASSQSSSITTLDNDNDDSLTTETQETETRLGEEYLVKSHNASQLNSDQQQLPCASLRSQSSCLGASSQDDQPQLAQCVEVKTVSELRFNGEFQRFSDGISFLIDGLQSDQSLSVQQNSIVEIMLKCKDNEFLERLCITQNHEKILGLLCVYKDQVIVCALIVMIRIVYLSAKNFLSPSLISYALTKLPDVLDQQSVTSLNKKQQKLLHELYEMVDDSDMQIILIKCCHDICCDSNLRTVLGHIDGIAEEWFDQLILKLPCINTQLKTQILTVLGRVCLHNLKLLKCAYDIILPMMKSLNDESALCNHQLCTIYLNICLKLTHDWKEFIAWLHQQPDNAWMSSSIARISEAIQKISLVVNDDHGSIGEAEIICSHITMSACSLINLYQCNDPHIFDVALYESIVKDCLQTLRLLDQLQSHPLLESLLISASFLCYLIVLLVMKQQLTLEPVFAKVFSDSDILVINQVLQAYVTSQQEAMKSEEVSTEDSAQQQHIVENFQQAISYLNQRTAEQ
ncbi:hypothetical protein MP228_003692 [Amoeboaphelidium protococcarum]|nr:hypothetical protein MP228_003692 [Amoeboaphelidium protococcarum]